MTLQNILEAIHRIYEGDTNYPASTSEDYQIRLGLVNDAIQNWFLYENTKWRELFKNESGVLTSTSIACPSDFSDIASLVKIKDAFYSYEKPENVLQLQKNDPSKRFFYITGKPGSYVININPTPAVGDSYTYAYYKTPTELSSVSDIPEMSKPMYIVYWVIARLYEADGRGDMVVFYEKKAEDVLSEMRILNEAPPFNNEFKISDDDVAYKLDGVSFGF